MKQLLSLSLALLSLAAFAIDDGDAIAVLLNSQSSQNAKVYAEAAKTVRAAADKGGVLQRYVIALVSRDAKAPEAARIGRKKREEWLESTREKIVQMAEERDNALAWYLLSLERNDMPALERAAEGGNVQAQTAWGIVLINQGLSMPSSNTTAIAYTLEKAFECFKSAATKKNTNGMYNLGMCYMHGYGCKLDPRSAFDWFRLAAENGHPEAINNIGGFYRDGIVVTTNAELSVRWFKKSAELGNAYGQLNYALALQRGDGVSRDEKAATELLKTAAEQDCPEAMTVYGMCFHAGRGVKKDPEQAFHWFRRAAEAGFPPAMENLAVCYERGAGTPKDVLKGALWRKRYREATQEN